MPAKDNKQQSQESGRKGKKKRKAKSPLLVDSGQAGQTGSTVGGVSGANVNKRQNINDLSASPINTLPIMASPNNPYTQQYPPYANYGTPIAQSPQYFQPTNPATPVPVDQTKPPWAQEILDEVKRSLTKIEKIEKTVDSINNRMSDMEIKMKDIDKRTSETEISCAFLSDTTDAHTTQLEQSKSEITTLKSKCAELNNHVKSLESERQKLGSKITDLESRSMRDNLIFYGIQEQRSEDCEIRVKELIKEKLQLQEDILFDRVHRLGQAIGAKPRPIVAKFHENKQRERVRQQAYEMRDALRQSGHGVGVQYPKEIRETRKILYPIMKKAESEGKTTRLVGDKLYINNTLYVMPEGQASA